MKKVFELVNDRNQRQRELALLRETFNSEEGRLTTAIKELIRLENCGSGGMDVLKIQLAETVLSVRGNPYGQTDSMGISIAECAILDIAEGCPHLKTHYFGNKTYSAYYQRCDCRYGFGPSHGGICDEVALKPDATQRELTEDEKDACIYYLKNYVLINKKAEKV